MANKINLNLCSCEALPSPGELLNKYPLGLKQKLFIESARNQIVDILEGVNPRLLLIVGPCSIHDLTAAKEYALKLKELASKVSDTFLVLMRVHFEKPRTTLGWKGLLHDPYLNGSHNIDAGLHLTRQILLELAEMEVPTAAEFLDPFSCYYLSDLISWSCIGARTSESQVHRQTASALPMPTAFKNGTSGNIEGAINGILTAAAPHVFLGLNEQGQIARICSNGNPYCHMVLRGGENKSNYDPESISAAISRLEASQLPTNLIIDCSHDNSQRKHEQQQIVFKSVIHQILEGQKNLKGLILESHLRAGNQPLPKDLSLLQYGISITDSCIDWTTTESLALWANEKMTSLYPIPHQRK